MDGTSQNKIPQLPQISDYRYENIFKVYQQNDGTFFYNLLNKVTIPDNINPNTYYTTVVNQRMPWTTISYNAYGTIELWWLIAILNKIQNPTTVPSGSIKIIKSEYVRAIISEIQASL